MTFTLRAHDGHYLCAELDGQVVANRDVIGPWEMWTLERFGDFVSIMSHHGKYLCAEPDGRVVADRESLGPWETWQVEALGHGQVALCSYHGTYLQADTGDVPQVRCYATSVGPWEMWTPNPSIIQPTRTGVVRVDSRSFVDDGGSWLGLGASYFPTLWMTRNEHERCYQNLTWLAEHHIDFTRIFADVSGPSWTDRAFQFTDPDWMSVARDAVALADECGIRFEWSIFAGPRKGYAPRQYYQACEQLAELIGERLDRVMFLEVRNEQEGPANETMLECARLLRQLRPEVAVALCGTPEKELPQFYSGSAANLGTVHWERKYEERGYRPIRQPWGYYELHSMPRAHVNNEPIGIDSSIASESDPVKLAVGAMTSWVTGEGAYVLHHGAGIRAGGAADLARTPPRKANVWEQPTLEQALALMESARKLMNPSTPSWEHHGHMWPSHPLELHCEIGDKVENEGAAGANRAYAATQGESGVVMVSGIHTRFRASDKNGRAWKVFVPRGYEWVEFTTTQSIDVSEQEASSALLIR